MQNFRLSDLIELTNVQKMVDAHYKAAGMPIGIIDALDASILVGAGWQDICVKFHRANPESQKRCQASDHYIKDHLAEDHPCHYKCQNGLWDIGIPIVVAERHLATMFLGQFFYEDETPDREFFVRQARGFGFDLHDYLAAFDRVPVFSRKKVEYILKYNSALVNFIVDLAENSLSRITAEKVLVESERKYRTVADFTYDWEYWIAPDGSFPYVSPSCERITGYRAEEFQKDLELLIRIIHPDDRYLLNQHLLAEHIMSNVGSHHTDFRLITRSGEERWIAHACQPVFGCSGQYLGRRASNRDITDRKRAEEALRSAHDELEQHVAFRTEALRQANEKLKSEITERRQAEVTLRQLSSRLLTTQEEEQHRIAMELHDQTGQDLNVLKLQLSALQNRLRKDQAALRKEFDKALTFTDGLIEEVRRLAHGLSPSHLEALGLSGALKMLIRNFSEKTRIHIRYDVEAIENVFPTKTQIVLYRIFQEALTNIFKHAQAKKVWINVCRKSDALAIAIKDNGFGFDSCRYRVSELTFERGMGLSALDLRARMIGAELKIISQPGQGTEIILLVPIDGKRGE